MKILALEASTTSAKAMIYDTASRTFEEKTRPYEKMYADETCHNAETVFENMARIGRELSDGKKIDIISLSGTWHSVLLCDRQMTPLTPVYPWTYTGAADLCGRYREDSAFVSDYYHRTGCMVNATYPLFKVLYLKETGTSLEGAYIVDQGTYNNYRLTGKFVTTKSLASGSGFLNIHSRQYDDDILKLAGTEKNQLPSLQESSRVYPLSEEGACLLGIPEGTPVVLTNPDGGLNQIGAGAIREGIMTFSVGTSGAMRMSTGRPVIPETPSAWCYLSPKNWMSGAASAGCCNCIDWFVRQINLGQSGYSDLEKNEQEILDTPVFLPFLYGERCPGWDDSRRGGFELLEPHHDISDMYRGVQQGILFNLYQCYQILVDVAGVPEQIKLSGGILNSAVWTRMCADIFGRTMEINDSDQSSLMGAVILAREIVGDISSVEDYSAPVKKIIRPDVKRHELYQEQYRKYLTFYNRKKENDHGVN